MIVKKKNTVSFISGLFLATLFFSTLAWIGHVSNILPTNHMISIRTAAGSPEYSGSGGDVAVSLNQSYSNEIFGVVFPNLDIVNNFTVPCPTDVEFGSTRTEIKIENIVTPDIDLIIEDDGVNGNKDFTASNPCAAQFTVPNDCIIESVSVRLSNSDAQEAKIQIALFSYDSENSRPAGTDQYDEYATLANFEFPKQTYNEWYTISGLTQLLDNSETDNNKWYIGLYDNSIGGGNAYWSYTRDDSLYSGDGVDDSECIQHLNKWNYVQDTEIPSCNIDFGLKIKLATMNNSSKPSDIQLEINGIPVADDGLDNSGTWTTENMGMIDADGDLDFKIFADWESVSCDVSEVHVEYGKTGFSASTIFDVKPGIDVQWIASVNGNVSGYDSRLDNSLMFTIPSIWNGESIRVFNDVSEITTITVSDLENGYSDAIVSGATDGANWYLTADSSNLLVTDSISMYKEGATNPTMTAFQGDTVEFRSTFLDLISSADPGAVPIELHVLDGVDEMYSDLKVEYSGSTIDVSTWDIASSLLPDFTGELAVQIVWHDDSRAAFGELLITIEEKDPDPFPAMPGLIFLMFLAFIFMTFFMRGIVRNKRKK